jgi:diketogulonate reductase-like aldo/keto reductase
MNKIPSVVLHTGTKIPQIALGTYLLKNQDTNAVI